MRNEFRDYYDIYALLKAGCSLKTGIRYACDFSRHKIHSKQIYTILTTPSLFKKTDVFSNLEPKYNIDCKEISVYIKEYIVKENVTLQKNNGIKMK